MFWFDSGCNVFFLFCKGVVFLKKNEGKCIKFTLVIKRMTTFSMSSFNFYTYSNAHI